MGMGMFLLFCGRLWQPLACGWNDSAIQQAARPSPVSHAELAVSEPTAGFLTLQTYGKAILNRERSFHQL
jgi:hypothetical protein